MKVFRLLFSALAASVLCVSAAYADTFAFSFGTSTDKFAGSGTLTGSLQSAATPDMPAEYLITAVSGTTRTTVHGRNRTIDSILAPGSFGSNDNLLYFDGSDYFFDVLGLSYDLRNGAKVNLATFLDTDFEVLMRRNGRVVEEVSPITISAVTTTPEPGSFVLLGTGLLGAVGVARRRFAL